MILSPSQAIHRGNVNICEIWTNAYLNSQCSDFLSICLQINCDQQSNTVNLMLVDGEKMAEKCNI